ncbi:hypothetical protein FIBSPDRAFT_881750 [Athelia psychrophila]|uniref:Uncharacterized protein n=1 Tax=Athelia psychrophila TaxID=1759441 RepID=A0A166WBE9_9AGAM|nr:hypothetical protein FIBSPDRAFT_881750 [Fibularhizoctonia sp. CBS 109695]
MSILRWEGEPTIFDADGNDLHNFVGEYERATPSDIVLNLWGWDEDNDSGILDYGGIAAEDIPVKVRVLNPRSGNAQAPPRPSFTGTPFYFYECDWALWDDGFGGCEERPEDLGEHVLDLGRPDLPGQPSGLTMRGPWVQRLYERNEQKLPLGGRQFETQWTRSEQWAVEALDIQFFSPDDDKEEDDDGCEGEGGDEDEDEYAGDGGDSDKKNLSPAICEYEVEATIHRVLLTPEYLGDLWAGKWSACSWYGSGDEPETEVSSQTRGW